MTQKRFIKLCMSMGLPRNFLTQVVDEGKPEISAPVVYDHLFALFWDTLRRYGSLRDFRYKGKIATVSRPIKMRELPFFADYMHSYLSDLVLEVINHEES